MTTKIPLTRGLFTVVDDADVPLISQYKWYADVVGEKFYARTRQRSNRSKISLHRLLLGFPVGLVVDHVNRDTLDNRRDNLRACSHRLNLTNSYYRKSDKASRFKGVSRDKRSSLGLWIAHIMVHRRGIHLGQFMLEEEAAHAYDEAAKKYFGEVAYLNFPGGK